MFMENQKILELKGITKTFPGVVALNNVTFDLYPGEIHCLVGGNGAGKSTLIKILSGMYEPTKGELIMDGKSYNKFTPGEARSLGIQTIYQETVLAQTLSVAENISLGDQMPGKGIVSWPEMNKRAKEVLEKLNVDVDPKTTVESLGIAGKQTVQIAKAIACDARVMIFDEPTASYGKSEIDKLFEIIANLKKSGVGIIYISHHMEEVFELADRITVLKDGSTINTYDVKDATLDILVQDMVGDANRHLYERTSNKTDETVFTCNNISGDGVKNVSFEVKKGEILGIGGMVGAKRTELLRLIFGAGKVTDGTVTYQGKTIRPKSPKQMMKMGMCMITEDRAVTGLLLDRTMRENAMIAYYGKFKGAFTNVKHEMKCAGQHIKRMNVAAHSPEQIIKTLSGGNQQKVILAKWFVTDADLFLMDEPTRGIDIAAKAEIYRIMSQITEEGKTVICVSSELPELVNICDRILIMKDGELIGEAVDEQLNEEYILTQIVGGTSNEK